MRCLDETKLNCNVNVNSEVSNQSSDFTSLLTRPTFMRRSKIRFEKNKLNLEIKNLNNS